jgi:hypothetical protein
VSRRRHAVLAAIPLVLLLGACGSKDADGALPTTAAAAPTSAASGASKAEAVTLGDAETAAFVKKLNESGEKVTSARMAVSMELDVAGFPDAPTKPFSFTGEGEIDVAGDAGHLVFDTSELAAAMGEASIPAKLEMIMAGGKAYVRVPEGSVSKAGGKHWVQMDGDAADASGLGFGGLGQLSEFSDPADAFSMLKDASKITKVGADELRGTKVTHYKVSLGGLDAGAAPDGSDAAGMLAMFAGMGGADGMPADLWVDDEGRVRKLAFTFDLGEMLKGFMEADTSSSTVPADFRFAMSLSFEMWDYGKPVDIEAPAPSDVADASVAENLFGS